MQRVCSPTWKFLLTWVLLESFGPIPSALALDTVNREWIISQFPRFADISGMESRARVLSQEIFEAQRRRTPVCLSQEERESKLWQLDREERASRARRIQRLGSVRFAEEAVSENQDVLKVSPSLEWASARGREIVDEALSRVRDRLVAEGLPFVTSTSCVARETQPGEGRPCDGTAEIMSSSDAQWMQLLVSRIRSECEPISETLLQLEAAVQTPLNDTVNAINEMGDGGMINALRLPWWIAERLALNDAALELTFLRRDLLAKERALLEAAPLCSP